MYVPTPFCPVCIFFFSARLGVFSVLLSCFFFSLRFYALVFCRIKCVWVVYHQGRTVAPGCVTRAPGFSRVGNAGGCPSPVRAGRAWQSRQMGGAPLLCRRRSGESQGALSTRVCPNQTPPAATLRAGRARTHGGRGGGSRETGPSWAFRCVSKACFCCNRAAADAVHAWLSVVSTVPGTKSEPRCWGAPLCRLADAACPRCDAIATEQTVVDAREAVAATVPTRRPRGRGGLPGRATPPTRRRAPSPLPAHGRLGTSPPAPPAPAPTNVTASPRRQEGLLPVPLALRGGGAPASSGGGAAGHPRRWGGGIKF